MLEKYKHISFDLDGTLVHTMPEYRHKIVPEVVKELGGVIQNKFSIDKFWFESGRDEMEIQKKLTIQPNETVYVGNSNEDAYFAKNAGVDFIYLERKEHQFDLRDYAIATIHSLSELFDSLPYGEVMKFDVA